MAQKQYIIPIFLAHQGCPHDCIFCNQEHISGKERGRRPDPDEIRRIIADHLERRPHDRCERVQVAFYGGSFTCLPERVQRRCLQAVSPWLKSGGVDSIRCSTRPDCISDNALRILKEFGTETVEIGVQSMDDAVLARARRGHSVADIDRAVTLLRHWNFEVGIQLMFGLPGESEEGFLAGVDRALALSPDFLRLYPTLVLEDSGLVSPWLLGDYQPFSLSAAVDCCARALVRCRKAGIPVIRIGLQASEQLAGKILAGPWHPAFGELVESRIWLRQILGLLAGLEEGAHMNIVVSHRDVSAVIGNNKTNIRTLDAIGYAGRYTITGDRSVEKGTLHALYKQS